MLGFANRLFLGQDPKLEFRRPGAGFNLLLGAAIAHQDPYWEQYWQLFDSPTDVATLLDSTTLSLAASQSPHNLVTLVQVLCEHLLTLRSSPTFPGPPPPRIGVPWSPGGSEIDLAREALNCVRVLSRVVPFIICSQAGQSDGLEAEIFWKEEKIRKETTVKEETLEEIEARQFVLEDEDEDEDTASPPQDEEWVEVEPLGSRLLKVLVDLCFVAGFTVPLECRTDESSGIAYVIWETGIACASTVMPPTSQHLLSARLEILRLIVLLLSCPSLLTPPQHFPSVPNHWRECLVKAETLGRKVVLCLLCSTLNTAFASPRVAPPSAGGLSSLAGGFGLGGALEVASGAAEKFGGVVLRREDIRGLLVGTCLQFLGILFVEHASAASDSDTPSPNTFSRYLSKLHRPGDFDFLSSGAFSVLSETFAQPLIPVVGRLGPASTSGKSGWAMETLIVLWRMITINSKFLDHLLETEQCGELLSLLVMFCLEFKDDEAHMGLVRVAVFILQTITAKPKLATKLNGPADLKLSLRGRFNVPGSLADFLIVSIYTLIVTTKGRLATLYPALLLAATNVSPFLKNLSVVSSTRLLQLFLAFSAPSFLLMEDGNPRLVFYLLETFNNLIHHQLHDNPNFVIAMIKSHSRFDELSQFTLSDGVAEIRRARQERRPGRGNSLPPSTVTSPNPTTSPLPDLRPPPLEREQGEKESSEVEEEGLEGETSEKARGKRRARSLSGSSVPSSEVAGDGEGPFVGKNGFVPTEGWVASWREGLPLDTILIMLSELRPKVLELSPSGEASPTAISFLSSANLLGVLPPASPIKARPFTFTPQSMTYLASLLYGSVYLTLLEFLREVPVQLFAVAQGQKASYLPSELVSGVTNFVISKARAVV